MKLFLLTNLLLEPLDLLYFFLSVSLELLLDSDGSKVLFKVVVGLSLGLQLVLKNLFIQVDLQRHLRIIDEPR